MSSVFDQAPDAAPPLPVDPVLIHRALERVRAAARGNGIDPDGITLDGFSGQTHAFEARSLFVITANVVEKTLPGRERGEVCASLADLQGRIRGAVENLTIDQGIIDTAITFLDRRKDKGFMADGLGLKFDRLNRTLLFYKSCTGCTGGKINCRTCQGAGLVNCVRCRGHRVIVCPQCRGARVTKGQNGVTATCRACSGQGEKSCPACHAKGRMTCRPCNGSGKTNCPRCAATGILSEVAYVSFETKTKFSYDRDAIPPLAAKLIDQIGPDMAVQNHADIRLLRQQEQSAAQQAYEIEEKVTRRDDLAAPYAVRLPFGTIGFRIDGQTRRGALFGLHPRLVNLPPFLEPALGPGLERLTQAAHGLGHVSGNIDEAVQYRIIADAMVAASELPPKKAVQAMRRRWPLGISGDVTDRMTRLAALAYRNVSKLPRLGGMAAGLLLGAGIDAAYLLGPARPAMLELGAPPLALLLPDALVAAGTGWLTAMLARLAAKQALRHLFRRLVPPERLRKIKPRAGAVSVYAYPGAGLTFIAVIAACLATGRRVPEWVVWLLDLAGYY